MPEVGVRLKVSRGIFPPFPSSLAVLITYAHTYAHSYTYAHPPPPTALLLHVKVNRDIFLLFLHISSFHTNLRSFVLAKIVRVIADGYKKDS